MSRKTPPRPLWWKNTFFWIGIILAGLAVWGFMAGEKVIRDPGQRPEGGLTWLYLVGAVLMLLNGYMTHKQSVQHYEEATDSFTPSETQN